MMVKPLTRGRLGNFLFQTAATIGYALKHGLEYTVPDASKEKGTDPFYLQHLVNPKWNPALPVVTLKEKQFSYQELPFEEAWRDRNIVLDGFWQSEKYFIDYGWDILNEFRFPWNPIPGMVSVHVRRGDYLIHTHKHPPVPIEWIRKAMSLFEDKTFVFFSDDIPWCKANFGKTPRCLFSTGRSEVEDLIAISNCESHICSASTFSWWGSWISQNENKRIIMPKLWFVPGYEGLDTSDIVPNSWQRLA